jgi:hypothetical protein
MREALLGKLLLILAQAPVERLLELYRYLTRQAWPELREVAPRPVPEPAAADAADGHCAQGAPAYVFQWTGRDWKVVFAGAEPFYLPDTLGAKYVDYLLHDPNVPISAFDLEVKITPEKGEARSRNSIQAKSDPQAVREYRRELRRLQAQEKLARLAGKQAEVERLEGEIKALEAALKGIGSATDTGERARSNVRLAVKAVVTRLRNEGEDALADHLEAHLSIGYDCLYTQPLGGIWE